jgi:opacity protein-like surface antigen
MPDMVRATSVRSAAAVLATLLCAAPPLGGQGRPLMVGLYGGGYTHVINLNNAGTADFTQGYEVGGTAGVQLNEYVGLHGDFTYARNQARGASAFAGRDFNRFFYGAHLEFRYPFSSGITPYVFTGGGAITIAELGRDATMSLFTRPAAAFGLGISRTVPATQAQVFLEAKNLVYRWNEGGFDRIQWDFSYALGLSYRFGP